MGLFDIFKRKEDAAKKIAAVKPKYEGYINVRNSLGQEFQIAKDEWVKNLLPDNLNKNFSDFPALYSLIVQALNDGFGPEVLFAAAHMAKSDPERERGISIHVVTLLNIKNYSDAFKVATAGLHELPTSAYLMTNLAKAQEGLGQQREAMDTLEKSLRIDPNQDNALSWFYTIAREKGGLKQK